MHVSRGRLGCLGDTSVTRCLQSVVLAEVEAKLCSLHALCASQVGLACRVHRSDLELVMIALMLSRLPPRHSSKQMR